MNRSALQLKHYHFVTLALRAREDIDSASLANSEGPYPDFDGIDLQPEVSLFSNDDAGECGPYLLRLSMAHEPKDDQFPYSFEVIVEGVFAVEQDEITDCKKMVVINGASVLYSAAREQLLTLSGRHMFGPMLLPALNFQHLDV